MTFTRHGVILGTFTFPKGTGLSAVDDQGGQFGPVLTGRYEFHGAFELRALTVQDLAAQQPKTGISGAEIMSRAPLVLSAEGVDVLVETQD